MKRNLAACKRRRRGSVLVLVAVLMVVLLAMVALAVDYGRLLVVRTELQAAADSAALAAARELMPDAAGGQSGALYDVRERAREYANRNLDPESGFVIEDDDIEIGRLDSGNLYSGVSPLPLFSSGMMDTVRVTVRRDTTSNGRVALFFGALLGVNEANVTATATATLRPGVALTPGSPILPIAVDIDEWNSFNPGDEFTAYADGRLEDSWGNAMPGNWGTVDIGADENSTSDISEQILNGLRQSDLDELAEQTDPTGQPRISDTTKLAAPVWFNGDTGLSGGLQHAIEDVIDQPNIIPLYDVASGNGNNSEFHIVGWGAVTVTSVNLHGNPSNKHVRIRRQYIYSGVLTPNPDLSVTGNNMDGAFASPGLVE